MVIVMVIVIVIVMYPITRLPLLKSKYDAKI